MSRKKKAVKEEEEESVEEKSAEPKKKKASGAKASKKKEVIQPEVNIGLVGHVDHGKTTLTERLSGKWTDTHSEEVKRGITIRLGYADSTFYRCPKCKGSEAYCVSEKCPECGAKTELLRKVSFVDAPGHESLMATMLAGLTIMDGALVLIAANEECPQPQTREHIMALQIIGVKRIIVVQNKIDLVSKEEAVKNQKQIKDFLKDTDYKDAPVIPISAKHNLNIDLLVEAVERYIPTPKRDPSKDPIMFVARSFDINKPGTKHEKLLGGVLGGALKQGVIKVGQEIEIKPGLGYEQHGQKVFKPIITKVTGLMTGGKPVKEVDPGGSIGLLTELDPTIVKSDSLAGNVVGMPGKVYPIWEELALETHLLQRVVGAKEDIDVEPVKMGEPLMLNINSAATVGTVIKMEKRRITCKLKLPICAEKGSRVTMSRMVGNRFRLIGYGIIS